MYYISVFYTYLSLKIHYFLHVHPTGRIFDKRPIDTYRLRKNFVGFFHYTKDGMDSKQLSAKLSINEVQKVMETQL